MIQEAVYGDPHSRPAHPEAEAAAIALITTLQVCPESNPYCARMLISHCRSALSPVFLAFYVLVSLTSSYHGLYSVGLSPR